MSTESSEAIRDSRKDWMTIHREMYLNSGGAEGHIMDLTAVGGHTIGTHCLVKYTGRKSGNVFITPLCYGIHNGDIVIVASKGGADHHPAWYLNIVDRPGIEFQVACQAWRGAWRIAEGDERRAAWDHMVSCFPFYQRYQESTSRVLPVLMLTAQESIPVFSAGDATATRAFLAS